MIKGAVCSSCIIMGPVCYTYNDLMPNNFDCYLLGRAYLQRHCHIDRCLGQKYPTTLQGTAAFSQLSEITLLLRLASYWSNTVSPCSVYVLLLLLLLLLFCFCFFFFFSFFMSQRVWGDFILFHHNNFIFLMSVYPSSSKSILCKLAGTLQTFYGVRPEDAAMQRV